MKRFLGLGCLGLIGLFVILAIIGSLSSNPKEPPTSQQAMAPSPTVASTPGPTSTPAPTPTFAPQTWVVWRTGGDGVYIRKSPSSGDKLKVWPEGAPMLVIGYDQEAEGKTWKNVKDPDGNIGWIPAEYLAVPTATPAPTSTPDRSMYKLELLSARGVKEYGFVTVEGQVKNISSQSLRNVMVMIEWYTDSGDFVKSDDALIEYNPILPGQTSPFKSITTDNPAMTRYRVSFKEMFGGQIPTLDSRKR